MNTPTHIASRLAELNSKVGVFAEVQWSSCGWDWNTDSDWDTELKGPAPAPINGPCYVIINGVTGLPASVVRTMSEAFTCAWGIVRYYRALERGRF